MVHAIANSNTRKWLLFLCLSFSLGTSLRLYQLGQKSIWTDELLSIWHARDIVNIKAFLSPIGPDAHPPLYFLLLKGWAFFGGGEFYLRLLSVIFAVLVIPSTYFLGRQFFSNKPSLLGSFLTAISPLLLLYDREVRMYPLFTLLSILSLFFFIKALKENKNITWAIYTFVTILNTYTHYYSFLLISSQWLFFLFMLPTYKSRWKKFIISQVSIAFLFLFWFPAFLFHANQNLGIGQLIRFPFAGGGVYFIKPLYLFFSYSIGQTILPWNFWLTIPAGVVFVGLSILGFMAVFSQKKTGIFFLSMICLPVIIANFFSELMPRYMIFLAPLFYLIVGQGIQKINKPVFQIFCLIIISLMQGYSIRNYYTNKEFHILAHVDPWREVGSYLKENVKNEDIVFNIGGVPINYYTGFNIPVLGENALQVIIKKLENNRNKFKRIWGIVSNPKYKKEGEEAISWLNQHYRLISQKRYMKDMDYLRKARLFRKDFLEYRIKVYLYQ